MRRSALLPIIVGIVVILVIAALIARPNVSAPAPGVPVTDPATPASETGTGP